MGNWCLILNSEMKTTDGTDYTDTEALANHPTGEECITMDSSKIRAHLWNPWFHFSFKASGTSQEPLEELAEMLK